MRGNSSCPLKNSGSIPIPHAALTALCLPPQCCWGEKSSFMLLSPPPFHACSWHSGARSAWLTANDRFCFWVVPVFTLLLGIRQAFVFCNVSDYSVPKNETTSWLCAFQNHFWKRDVFPSPLLLLSFVLLFSHAVLESSPTSRLTNHPPTHQDECRGTTNLYFRHHPDPLVWAP